MARLFIDLYDDVDSRAPFRVLDDQESFQDLNKDGIADKTARIVIRPGSNYRRGDHIRLLDEVRRSNTNTRSIDPSVVADVDLNIVDFADKAAAVQIVTNPAQTFRLRVLLYNSPQQTAIPDIVLYDWEFSGSGRFADLNLFHFADKAAFIRVQRGPEYKEGDRIVLLDSLPAGSRSMTYQPGDYDLNADNWADKAAGVQFVLQQA